MKQPRPDKKNIKATKTIPRRYLHLPPVLTNNPAQTLHRLWAIISTAAKKFFQIDGVMWAGAFAFNVFFSLFPLVVLFVTIAAFFVDRNKAVTEIIGYIERYIPISGEMQDTIFNTVAGVANASGKAGAVAILLLIWVSIQCIVTLVSAINRAWGTTECNWWHLPIKSLVLFTVMSAAVLFGITFPVLADMARDWIIPLYDFRTWVYDLWGFLIPLVTVFFSLSLFYMYTPSRLTRFAEVWGGALCATIFLWVAENLFVIYLKEFATLNAIYGAFGGVMALLLWIYLSGCIFVFGACICAAQAETVLLSMHKLE